MPQHRQNEEINARVVDVVYVVFVACVLLNCHLEQNALMQRRQEAVKVDMLQTKSHFLN